MLFHNSLDILLNSGYHITPADVDLCPGFVLNVIHIQTLQSSKTNSSKTRLNEETNISSAAVSDGVGIIGCSNGEILRWFSETNTFVPLQILSGVIGSGTGQSSRISAASSFSALTSATSAATASSFSRMKHVVREIFSSPNAMHNLLILSNGDVCYVDKDKNGCYGIPSLRNYQIRCVCWNTWSPLHPASTQEILLGTSKGIILSVVIAGGKDRTVQPIFNFQQHISIEQILVFELPLMAPCGEKQTDKLASSSSNPVLSSPLGHKIQFCIIVATPTQLFQFTGGPTIEQAFQSGPYLSTKLNKSGHLPPNTVTHLVQPLDRSTSSNTASLTLSGGTQTIMAESVKYEKIMKYYGNLIFECPKKTQRSELHKTVVLTDQLVSNILPSENTKAQLCTNDTTTNKQIESFLLWWKTGAGVLLSVLKPETITTVSNDPSKKESIVGTGYKCSSPPTLIPFTSQKPSLWNQHPMSDSSSTSFSPTVLKGRGIQTRFCLRQTDQFRHHFSSLSSNDVESSHNDENEECKSIALTAYHLLMLQTNRLIILSRISRMQVQCVSLPPVRYGIGKKLVTDPQKNRVYLLTTRYLLEVTASCETECLWFHFLSIGDYSAALQTLNRRHKLYDIICCEYAKHLLRQYKLTDAMLVLSRTTSISIEDIILRILMTPKRCEDTILTLLMQKIHIIIQEKNTILSHKGTCGGSSYKKMSTLYPGFITTLLLGLRLWLLADTLQRLNYSEYYIEILKHHRQLTNQQEHHLTNKSTNLANQSNRFVSVCGNWVANKDINKHLSLRITETIHRRKRLLFICQAQMEQLKMDEKYLKTSIYDVCEAFGRPEASLIWSNLIYDQEMQVLEAMGQNDFETAIMYLAADPPSESHLNSENQLNLNRTIPTITEWRYCQMYLISKFGPQLFLYEPTKFTALLLKPKILSTHLTNGIPQLLEKLINENPSFIDFFYPIVLRSCIITNKSSDSGTSNSVLRDSNLYTDLHRSEALKLLEKGLSLLLPKSSPTHTGHQQSSGKLSRLSKLGEWSSINGIWNSIVCILASCWDTQADLLKSLSLIDRVHQDNGVFGPDLYFSLRYCAEHGQDRTVIVLLTLLGMHEAAVRVALDIKDIDMAKLAVGRIHHASSDSSGLSLKRRLWRNIAAVAATILDPPNLLTLLQESNSVLPLHESLEFLSSPSIIGAYRDALCSEFDRCETRVREKQAAVEYNREVLETLKAKLKEQSSVSICNIHSTTPCLSCRAPLSQDRFYVFPCKHAAHAVCVHRLKHPFMDSETKSKYRAAVIALRDALQATQTIEAVLSGESDLAQEQLNHNSKKEDLKECERQVDGFLCNECPLCGNLLIETIAVPFVSQSEISPVMSNPMLSNDEKVGNKLKSPWIIGDGPLPVSGTMDMIYSQSNVLMALRDTLRDLTKDNFITRTVADRIFGISCTVLRRNIAQRPTEHATIDIQGRLMLYRFRKDVWTLYVEQGRLDILLPHSTNSPATSSCRIPFKKAIKIIAADKALWEGNR